jgi:AraC family transcriptional regulator
MEVNVVELEPMRLAAISHRGSYQSISKAFGELNGWQESNGLLHGPLVAVYYDDPHQVPEADLRSEAGVVIHGDAPISGDRVHEVKIPGGRYAMASYRGDYSGLPKAWEEFYMQGTIPAGLKTKADACFERYINTPMDSAPEDLITELYAPLV